jgi:tripartite-type tricarboxylate transporter receptor subunit TctC
MGMTTRRAMLAGTLSLGLPALAHAQAGYLSRPVRIVVGFGAGGLADITVRLVCEQLSERLGQQVLVDNRPGAGGALAASAAAAAAPDGHTLTVLSTGNAINRTLFRSQPYDPVADFTAITTLVTFDLLLLVATASPFRDLAEVLAAGRGGRRLAIGTISAGSTQNLSAEWLRVAAGLDATIVPYRSTPEVLTSIQRGDVQLGFESYAAAKGVLDGGQIRAVACTGHARSALLPEVPTLRESGLGDYAVVGWNAIFAPARTPQPAVELLNQHLIAILERPETRARLLQLGVEPAPATPEATDRLLRQDIEVWARVIERARIQRQ